MIPIAKTMAEMSEAMKKLELRAEMNNEEARQTVMKIIADVRARGDAAVLEYTEKFDDVKLEKMLVSQAEIEEGLLATPEKLMFAIQESAENIRAFHEKQKQKTWLDFSVESALGQKVTPLTSAGIYIPGGRAAYPSSVLMNAIPASIAGVGRVVMVTPPGKDGKLSPAILTAAYFAGITEIYKVGGAQAVAALAYGTQEIASVDKITGPGNLYVSLAKREVFGKVGIDMIAGPSEVLIIADESANPEYIAADMLAQAEHDPLAAAILICTNEKTAESAVACLESQLAQLERREIAEKSIRNYGTVIVVKDEEEAFMLSNSIAPEHLEILLKNSFEWIGHVQNAGAIFLGEYTPEAFGDYFAGPNHTLPTNGTARFSSPLSVDDFVKKSSILYSSKESFAYDYEKVACFAEAEGLTAHAKSAKIRFKEEGDDA